MSVAFSVLLPDAEVLVWLQLTFPGLGFLLQVLNALSDRHRQTLEQVLHSTGIALVLHVASEVVYHPVQPLLVRDGRRSRPTERPKGFLHKRGEGWAEKTGVGVPSIPNGYEVAVR